ncbi:ABC transporter substrate-binding protein [Zooshikella ganghwensis]|uniref:ABC transporter substrate-binding protein n=1 Tax=Zooshikella ganghwensis TaxID=202772 RepID=UPI000485BFA3|nr:ABC transporter substrate-binding protein [Zooshikella ganghwensis]
MSVKSQQLNSIVSRINCIWLLCLLIVYAGLISAKERKSHVVVYSVTSFSNEVSKAFRKATGIKAHIYRMNGSGATLARLEGERDQPKGDVWIGGSIGAHAQAAYEGLIQPYRPTNFDELDPTFRNPLGNNSVTGLYTGVLGFIVNNDILKANNLPVPHSWQSLVESKYHGLIGMKSPMVSGTAYTTVATLVQMMGEEAAFNYLDKLHNNLAGYLNSHSRLTSQGRLAITITFLHEWVEEKNRFPEKNIDIIVPEEGTGHEIGGLSLIKNGPNPAAAKKLIDFILSEKGQRLFIQSNYQNPVLVKMQRLSRAPKVNRSQLIDYDFTWAGQNRHRLIELYKKRVLKN